jgi:hypothetical protein
MTDSKREYEELIERLGKLTGPDRGLDLEIHSILIDAPLEQLKALESLGGTPEFTKSIDAAMTLGGLEVLQRSLERLLEQINSGTWKSGPEVTANDIARIICAEALRARSQ